MKAAQQAKQRDEDDVDVAVDSRKVGGIKQVSLTYIWSSQYIDCLTSVFKIMIVYTCSLYFYF